MAGRGVRCYFHVYVYFQNSHAKMCKKKKKTVQSLTKLT